MVSPLDDTNMSQTTTAPGGESISLVAFVAVFVGLGIVGFGAILVPTSVLGGLHIAAIGLSLALAGLFTADWVADRLGISPVTQRRLSMAFATLAVVLLVLFVVINYASFESELIEESSG